MKIKTFDDDLLGLRDFADRLESFIEVDHDYVTGSLVVALSSKYGTGKTTFLEMWKDAIDTRDEKETKPLVISLNAWESDYFGDPLFAIISGLVSSLDQRTKHAKAISKAAKSFGFFSMNVAEQLANSISGINWGEVRDKTTKQLDKSEEPILTDTFTAFQERKDAMSKLQDALRSLAEDHDGQIIFLVDELDRCRPDFAITYLETIKHIFDLQGVTFIIATDREQLENSARTAFGQNLDFDEYYRKFIHREVTLPPISEEGYRKLASACVKHYVKVEGKRISAASFSDGFNRFAEDLVTSLGMTPRQIHETFRISGHIFQTTEDKDGKLLPTITAATFAMAAFKVGKPELYKALANKSLDTTEGFNELSKVFNQYALEYYFTAFLSAGAFTLPEGTTAEGVLVNCGYLDPDPAKRAYSSFRHDWGTTREGRVKEIYDKIEQLMKWA